MNGEFMRKKIFSILGLFIMLFSLTGCIKYNAVIEVKEDKSMNYSMIYAMTKSIMELDENQSEELIDENQRKKLVENGFKIENYEDDTYKGFKVIKTITNIDNISSENDVEYRLSNILEEQNNVKMFKITKGENKNIYTANFIFNARDSKINDENIENENQLLEETPNSDVEITTDDNLSELSDTLSKSLDLKFMVRLPYAALSSNATSKSDDGKELIWNLSDDKLETIMFQFSLNNSVQNNNFPIIILGIGLLSAITIFIIIKRKNSQKHEIPVVPRELTTMQEPVEGQVSSLQAPIEVEKPKEVIQVEAINPINPYESNVTTTNEPIPVNNIIEPNQEKVVDNESVDLNSKVTPKVTSIVEPVILNKDEDNETEII